MKSNWPCSLLLEVKLQEEKSESEVKKKISGRGKMVRLVTYVSCSALVTALTVTKYALQYKQFYPTVVHIVNSPACNLVCD